MRPVERGPCPSAVGGQSKQFDCYEDARPYLTDRLGAYCSFCEIRLPLGLAVEHIRHKVGNPSLEREWTNFLLACPNCNSTKGTKIDTQADVDAHLWPHADRTFEAFEYDGGVVRVANQLSNEFETRAHATAEMVGLFRRPGYGMTREQDNRASDRRWLERMEAWDDAIIARDDLHQCDTPEMRRQIVRSAQARGFWSVWMTVFADDPSMRDALCEAFPGTARTRVH
jgi:hypothetical protein